MDTKDVELAIYRLNLLLHSVRLQNSGADVHQIGNIRNTAGLLKDLLEDDPSCIKRDTLFEMIKNTEKMVIDFYKQKYFKGE